MSDSLQRPARRTSLSPVASAGWVRAVAPGRVNLIGEHTDYAGGLVLPMAIDLATTVEGKRGGARVHLASDDDPDPADLPLDINDPEAVDPPWARYVAGVIAEIGPATGFTGTVSTTIPVGTGLSSSAALEVAVALALGADLAPTELARACQRAEHRASGVPRGVMDQLVSVAGVAGQILLIDCANLAVTAVPFPDDVAVVVVDSGERRSLTSSAYGDRRAEVAEAERILGPLPHATLGDLDAIDDPVVRRRARHVVTENGRVRAFAEAVAAGDVRSAGALMADSHASLRDDFDASTPGVDALVARLRSTPGVHGARMTGGGWGGCVVALADPGALDEGWRVTPSRGAYVEPAASV